jgi:curved DNA-binding protein CbpA
MAEKVPRLIAGIDIRSFKLDATDGFLLTRIDGRLGPKELSRDTGLPDFSIARALEKLEKLGVIEIVDPTAPARAPAAPVEQQKRPALPQFADFAGADARYDASEIDEECDLPRTERKKVLDVYYRLDDLDHYTLLGVGREADKKTVKRAYMGLAAIMHPDKYFKKNLGTFKPKMEVLFNRITEAHDTLVDAAKRLDYDAYLDEVATTRGMEAMFERALEEAKHAPPSAPVAPATDSHPAVAESTSGVYAAPVTAPPGPLGNHAEDLKARREALARRLLGGNTVRPPTKSAPAPSERPNPLRYSNTADAVDALKRRYEQRVENATVMQARKYVQAGEDAMSKNDVVAAASSFSIATKFAPDDTQIAMRYQEVKNQADKILSESYSKQAAYEERNQHWQEAARSWQKVCKIKVGDAKANERAAHCMLQFDEADLQQAAEHAKVAVSAAPDRIENHVTLAEIYLKAGHKHSAKRAAETGLKLDAKNASLLGVLKKAGK